MKEDLSILVVGVGGQGSILFSKILGEVFLTEGYEVKISEVHGMAQRGGSVVTFVRAGEKVYSPLVDKAQANYIIAFEKLEALRWLGYLKKDGVLIFSDYEIPPMSVISGKAKYPDVIKILEDVGVRYYRVDIPSILKRLKNPRVQNIIMLGFFSNLTNIDSQVWIEAIKNNIKANLLDINLKAFELGRSIVVKEEVFEL